EIVTTHTRLDGKKYPIEVRLSALKKEQQPMLIAVSRDISVRKKAEDELNAYKEHLEELVAERTAELQASNRELESYSYSIAHDLRAPLRSIIGFSQIVIEDVGDRLGESEGQYLHKIVNAGKHMSQLIDDILELGRLSRVDVEMQEVNISQIANDVVEELMSTDVARQVDVTISSEMKAKADPQLIRVSLQNLIGNAWKYSAKTPHPKIEIGVYGVNRIRTFYIKDNGAGFDMRYKDKLFKPFQRLHGEKDFEGTGIGLATVERIIERHGGKIWAVADINKGATFYFTLPAVEVNSGVGQRIPMSV
ncbi:sensor histidine kinase, partial [Kaarinaea lacus]